MKKTILGLATAAALGAIATPAAAQVYGDTARVISATPIHDQVAMPRRECRMEPTTGYEGNSIEKDSDDRYRRASRDVYVERVPVTRDVERCDTIADAEERIVGYDVRYEYNGREFRARMPYDPGEQMPVNVEVRPPLARESLARPRTPNYRGTY